MRISVTSTRSKVKVKVTELPLFRKLHFSRAMSSAILACSSKLMVDGDNMRPGLQFIQSPIFEFPSRKAIMTVQTSPNVDILPNSNGHISVLRDATVTSLGTLVVLHVLCMLM